jgi:hypothetical protein
MTFAYRFESEDGTPADPPRSKARVVMARKGLHSTRPGASARRH